MNHSCPFCDIIRENETRIIQRNELAIVMHDGFPISKEHTLIIPKRHISSFFDATEEERIALLELLDLQKKKIDKEFGADGYNIGINDGTAAGQTVPHLHIHLIPRYHGDTEDPRGGVRWLFPDKADYWSK